MICSSGQDLKSINNRAYAKYNTGKAEKIVIALDKCGIPYFARFNNAEISLTYDNDYAVSVSEMSNLTEMTEDELKHDLSGEIFRIPHTENTYQTASEYLSGDIRKKLKTAEEIAEYDSDFNINVNALKAAMPEPLKAGDIDVKIGATWIDPKYYEQFIYETLQTPKNNRNDVNHYASVI